MEEDEEFDWGKGVLHFDGTEQSEEYNVAKGVLQFDPLSRTKSINDIEKERKPSSRGLCALKTCDKEPLNKNEGIVLILASKKLLLKSKKHLDKFLLNWQPRGAFGLHRDCWEHFLRKSKYGKAPWQKQERALKNKALETAEYFESSEQLIQKGLKTARLLVKSSHAVVFTGAGVSTASGIPDYCGTSGIDTVQSMTKITDDAEEKKDDESDEDEGVDYTELQPTKTHCAITKLHKLGLIKYVITQNCDNLHVKSGLPRTAISDLHGNVFVEYCEKCRKEYVRKYSVDAYSTDCYDEKWWEECPSCRFNHYTGRKCTKKKCRGKLRDTIVNFGDDLHDGICGGLDRANQESEKADLMIGLGSSLMVPWMTFKKE